MPVSFVHSTQHMDCEEKQNLFSTNKKFSLEKSVPLLHCKSVLHRSRNSASHFLQSELSAPEQNADNLIPKVLFWVGISTVIAYYSRSAVQSRCLYAFVRFGLI